MKSPGGWTTALLGRLRRRKDAEREVAKARKRVTADSEDVPSSVELRWRPIERQAALTL